ncbi:ABC transporter ATP-binding protein [Sphingomonas sp. AX6]|uniref:ABC transporter ATP-binding protein n=1 Tax=Sphingomonas sp. AX6 TaxID=2653171 RepID=UPI0013578AAF|nr:ABC transporter ATP-binding protein [Sphingomonas sp. AX6]
MTAPALSVADVAKSYGSVQAVDGASFDLAAGQVTCLLGRSGCGKSTLLRLIAGLECADRGTIAGDTLFADSTTHLPPEKRGIGLVFQDYALFPHLDVTKNVGFGLAHLNKADRATRVAALLDRFQIAHLAHAYPHSLSGGEQQRVAIARALAREPAVVLMDEPFSGLDGALRRDIQLAILGQLRASGAAVLIVTHDAEEAMRVGDRIVLMAEGRVLQTGTPEECYAQPTSAAAARLLGPVNALPGMVKDGRIETALGTIPAPNHPDGPATLLARPEAFGVAGDGAGFDLTVSEIAYLGDRYEVSGMVGDTPILAHLATRPILGRGTVRLSVSSEDVRIV